METKLQGPLFRYQGGVETFLSKYSQDSIVYVPNIPSQINVECGKDNDLQIPCTSFFRHWTFCLYSTRRLLFDVFKFCSTRLSTYPSSSIYPFAHKYVPSLCIDICFLATACDFSRKCTESMLSSEEHSVGSGEEPRWPSPNPIQNMNERDEAPETSAGKNVFSSNLSRTPVIAKGLFIADWKKKWHSLSSSMPKPFTRRNSESYKEGARRKRSWEQEGCRLRRRELWDDVTEHILSFAQDSRKLLCVKATSHAFTAPKGKHIRAIVQELQNDRNDLGKETTIDDVVYFLQMRMFSDDWVVKLKALAIFHHLSRHNDEPFVDYILHNRRRIFAVDFFPAITKEGVPHNIFVKWYNVYVEQLFAIKTTISFPISQQNESNLMESSIYQHLSTSELLTFLPVIMDTLDVLRNIPLDDPISRTAVAALSISMTMKDLSVLSTALCDGISRLFDVYFDENICLAAAAYEVYERSVNLLTKLCTFSDTIEYLAETWRVPAPDFISSQLLASIQEHVGKTYEREGCRISTASALNANRLKGRREVVGEKKHEISLEGPLYDRENQFISNASLQDTVGSNVPDTVAYITPHAMRWSVGTFVYEGMNNVFDAGIRMEEDYIIVGKTKWEIVRANLRGDFWKTVCIKATNSRLAPPEGRHVTSILRALSISGDSLSHDTTVKAIFHHLKERMYSLHYCNIIKSQTIFHHILREGEDAVNALLESESRQIFATELFANDIRNSIFQGTFIESYGRYLERRLGMMETIHFPPPSYDETGQTLRTAFSEKTADNLVVLLPALIDTVHTLTTIPIDGLMAHTPVASVATSMLFSDLTMLFTAISNGVIRLLDLHSAVPETTAALACNLYARFTTLLSDMCPFLAAMRARTSGCRVPVVDDVCLQLGRTVREHVERLPKERQSDNDCETRVTNSTRMLLRRIASNGDASEEAGKDMNVQVRGRGKGAGYQDEFRSRKGLLAEIDILFFDEIEVKLPSCAAETMPKIMRERWKGTAARWREDMWQYVVMKATSGEARAPRRKYVTSLLLGLMWGGDASSRMSAVGSIVYYLRERLWSAEWITVIRALTLFHYILRGTVERFWEGFAGEWSEVFEMKGVEDRMRREGMAHAKFIRAYGAYISGWLKTRRTLEELYAAICGEGEEKCTERVLKGLEIVLDTVEAVLGVEEVARGRGECVVAVGAIRMIRKDLEMMWGMVLRGVDWIVEEFVELKFEDEMIGLEIYDRAVGTIARVRRALKQLKEDER